MELDPLWQVHTPRMFATEPENDKDIIMLCKQFWSSSTLAQPPMVFLPNSMVAKLPGPFPKFANPRKESPITSIKEYRKTAKEAGKAPWNMKKAEKYLTHLCDTAEKKVPVEQNTILPWMMSSVPCVRGEMLAVPDGWSQYAPGKPEPIDIKPVPNSCGWGKGKGAIGKASHAIGKASHAIDKASHAEGTESDVEAEATIVAIALPDDENEVPKYPGDTGPQKPKRFRIWGKKTPIVKLVLGCSRCKWAKKGCNQCRNPKFQGKRGSKY